MRHIPALNHDPQFQAIVDRNSQLAFTKNYAAYECGLSLDGNAIDEISVDHVKKLLQAARQQRDGPQASYGRPPSLTEDQEQDLVEFLTKRELLADVERRYDKILTSGGIRTFLARHMEQITTRTIHSQEDP